MTLITIRQADAADVQEQAIFQAVVSFDHGPEHQISLQDPFEPKQEDLLEWYFEQHLRFPFTDQKTASQVAQSITEYGEKLFGQVFPEGLQRFYGRALAHGPAGVTFEILGSPAFHRLHWEALKDPNLPRPFALEAPMLRKNLEPCEVEAVMQPSPTLNILVVTARPGGQRDVGYRTITRPLVEALGQTKLPVRIDILRPGSFKALVEQLETVRDRHGTGYYHVIHLDTHGALLRYDQFEQVREAGSYTYSPRFGREAIQPYEGLKAFISLEGENAEDQLVTAEELAKLLTSHGIPVVVLNACQSSKQVGASETSLASYLMRAGVQVALGMRYSVTVSAAALLMQTLYERLFAGDELAAALRRGRLALHNDKRRRVYFDQLIELEDWLLPVVYQNRAVQVQVRDFTPAEAQEYYAQRARRFPFPEPRYGFFGRDLDVLEIEKKLLRQADGKPRNLLLVKGLGGAGKTTLLKHLAAWWQTTHFVDRVFYFGYDEKAHTPQQVLHAMAKELLGEAAYHATFTQLNPQAGQQMLAQRLRSEAHLLILDNLESVTGASLAVPNTLSEAERKDLKSFLAELAGGKTSVLLGSRGEERWLVQAREGERSALHEDDVYELPGLDEQAASALTERILKYHAVSLPRGDPDLKTLLGLLAGYPLALEVVLPNLKQHSPKEVLAALRAGDPELDKERETDQPLQVAKTESILKCIEYSHSNLSPEAQGLLLCLAPFTGIFNRQFLPQYTQQLKAQPALVHLPFDKWPQVLQEARDWGLLSPHPDAPEMLRLQPVLPYFLRQALSQAGQAEVKAAVEAAFRLHYDGLGGALRGLLSSKKAQEKQLGLALVRLEYENLYTALFLALEAQGSIFNTYATLSAYLDAMQDQRAGLALGEAVLARLQGYPAEVLAGELGAEFLTVLDDIARRQLLLKQLTAAEKTYQEALAIALKNKALSPELIKKMSASIYHQLGRVAQEQRQWTQAEGYYQQALQIYIEYNDRYEQADTYHQLGVVAEEQRQWAQAEKYYQQALGITIEFNDRYGQSTTLHTLGSVALGKGELEQAKQYYHQALEIYIEFNDWNLQAMAYHQLGMVAQAQRQWAQAEAYYQQALGIKIEFNDRYGQASTYGQLGILAEEQNKYEQASKYYVSAMEIFSAYGDEHNTAKTIRLLARLWQASQDDAIPTAVAGVLKISEAEARELLQKALE